MLPGKVHSSSSNILKSNTINLGLPLALLSLDTRVLWRVRCECVQVTEIRQASFFSETKSATPRSSQRPAAENAPVFELPPDERAASPRRDTVRAGATRDAAHEANAARDATRRNGSPARALPAGSGNPRASAEANGRPARNAAPLQDGAASDELNLDGVDTEPASEAQAVDSPDSAGPTKGSDARGEDPSFVIEAVAPQSAASALLPLVESTESVATAGPADAPAGPGQPVDSASGTVSSPAVTEASLAIAGAAAFPVAGPQVPADPAKTAAVTPGATSPAPAAGAATGSAGAAIAPQSAARLDATTTSGPDDQAPPVEAQDKGKQVAAAQDKDKDKPAQAADDQPKADGAGKAETPVAAKDARVEAPPGFPVATPKIATDLPGTDAVEKAHSAQAHAAEGRATPISAVPLEIGLRTIAGLKHFDIRLDPVELGRVDVRLEIDDAGSVTARLTVDRVETLHLLQRDARTLERAFEQAGLKPSEGGVNISLRDQDGRQGFGQADRDTSEQNARRSRAFVHIEPEIAEAQGIRRALGPGRIDLSI